MDQKQRNLRPDEEQFDSYFKVRVPIGQVDDAVRASDCGIVHSREQEQKARNVCSNDDR